MPVSRTPNLSIERWTVYYWTIAAPAVVRFLGRYVFFEYFGQIDEEQGSSNPNYFVWSLKCSSKFFYVALLVLKLKCLKASTPKMFVKASCGFNNFFIFSCCTFTLDWKLPTNIVSKKGVIFCHCYKFAFCLSELFFGWGQWLWFLVSWWHCLLKILPTSAHRWFT